MDKMNYLTKDTVVKVLMDGMAIDWYEDGKTYLYDDHDFALYVRYKLPAPNDVDLEGQPYMLKELVGFVLYVDPETKRIQICTAGEYINDRRAKNPKWQLPNRPSAIFDSPYAAMCRLEYKCDNIKSGKSCLFEVGKTYLCMDLQLAAYINEIDFENETIIATSFFYEKDKKNVTVMIKDSFDLNGLDGDWGPPLLLDSSKSYGDLTEALNMLKAKHFTD